MQKLRPDMDIGHNIQFLRHLAGLTQDETVAKLHLMNLNISKSTYAKLETNRMNIKVSELVALSIIFNANFDDFFVAYVTNFPHILIDIFLRVNSPLSKANGFFCFIDLSIYYLHRHNFGQSMPYLIDCSFSFFFPFTPF